MKYARPSVMIIGYQCSFLGRREYWYLVIEEKSNIATKALELGRTLTSHLSKFALTSNCNEYIVNLYIYTMVLLWMINIPSPCKVYYTYIIYTVSNYAVSIFRWISFAIDHLMTLCITARWRSIILAALTERILAASSYFYVKSAYLPNPEMTPIYPTNVISSPISTREGTIHQSS